METAMNYLPGMEANQQAILQAWPRIWTRDYSQQIQLAFRAGLELGASVLQVQRSNSSTTLSRWSVKSTSGGGDLLTPSVTKMAALDPDDLKGK